MADRKRVKAGGKEPAPKRARKEPQPAPLSDLKHVKALMVAEEKADVLPTLEELGQDGIRNVVNMDDPEVKRVAFVP